MWLDLYANLFIHVCSGFCAKRIISRFLFFAFRFLLYLCTDYAYTRKPVNQDSKQTNMIQNTIPTLPTSPYWSLLKGLNNKEKLDLIVLLSSSLIKAEPAEENPSQWASRFVGVWKDSRTADEIVNDIREARTANSFDIALWRATCLIRVSVLHFFEAAMQLSSTWTI